MNCNKCGCEIKEGNLFCTNCGCKIGKNPDKFSKMYLIRVLIIIFLIILLVIMAYIGLTKIVHKRRFYNLSNEKTEIISKEDLEKMLADDKDNYVGIGLF
ncbi:MAG: zinc ribbon domain-containing protein [Clostridia bacterium]|nr:zinc ribbon domain-containing protein [Clostridia bacterium]